MLQMIIMEAIPDIPEEIDIQLQRTEFIERKLIDKVGDDHDDDVVGEEASLEIHPHSLGAGVRNKSGEGEGSPAVYGISHLAEPSASKQ
jgi:hypothetical protein